MVETTCSECKCLYGTYPVILKDSLASMSIEFSIRDIYYDEDMNVGLCQNCREKLYKDPVAMIRLWALARTRIMIIDDKLKKKDVVKAYAIIDARERDLEKTPEVIELYAKNARGEPTW